MTGQADIIALLLQRCETVEDYNQPDTRGETVGARVTTANGATTTAAYWAVHRHGLPPWLLPLE